MEKVKNIIIKNKKNLIIILAIILYLFYSYFDLVNSERAMTQKIKFFFILVEIFSFIIFLFVGKKINKMSNEKIKPENLFLLFAIFFGLLYLIFIPVLQGTDEPQHFYRGYQVSTGNFIPDNKTMIPKNLMSLWSGVRDRYSSKYLLKSTEYNNQMRMDTSFISNYSPFQYIPQSLGCLVSKIFNLSPTFTVYLSRFFNLLTYISICYFAIKKIPYLKLFTTILYTSPALLSIASTCSPDVLLNSFMLLFLAIVLKSIKDKEKLKKKDYILLTISSFFIAISKVVYIPYLFILLLIPNKCFNSKRTKYIYLSLIIFFSIVINFGWIYISPMAKTSDNNVNKQLIWILYHPLSYVMIVFRFLFTNIEYYIKNIYMGHEMLFSLLKFPAILETVYLVVAILPIMTEENKINFTKKQKILIYIIFATICCGFITVMYLYESSKKSIGNLEVVGVQSRYFVSIIPLFVITFNIRKKIKLSEKKYYDTIYILNYIVFVSVVSNILRLFYNA